MSTLHRTNGQGRSVGELVSRASGQVSQLVRDELQLARLEMTQKGKRARMGGGLYGAAGLVAFLASQAAVACAIAGLAVVWPVWLAALTVTVALLLLAGLLALLGKTQVKQATPAKPQQAIEGMHADIEEIKGRAHR